MSTQHTAQPHSEETQLVHEPPTTEVTVEVDALADVIELSDEDHESWYQRNSGDLPKSEAGMAESHRRNRLPTPENEDKTSIVDRVRGLLHR